MTEVCQFAAKVAIRQCIMADIQRKAKVEQGFIVDDADPVPNITVEHFNEALNNSRRSISKQDM